MDTPINQDQKESLEIIRDNGENLLTLVNDILDFSRIESGSIKLDSSLLDFTECVESSIEYIQTYAVGKHIEFVSWIDPSIPNIFIGDLARIRQVIVNLLSNAVDFTEKGEILLSCTMEQSTDGANSQPFLKVQVKDPGTGISETGKEFLFDVYHQSNSATRNYRKRGLGLAISKRLIEMMGGKISFSSSLGKGSSFEFVIPIKKIDVSNNMETSKDLTMAGKRIFILSKDDNEAQIISLIMKGWGAYVLSGSSIDKFYKNLDRGSFNLLIVDDKFVEANLDFPVPTLFIKSEINADLNNSKVTSYIVRPIKAQALLDAVQKIWSGAVTKPPIDLILSENVKMAEKYPLAILIAEDNITNQRVANIFLKELGYRADTVTNGIEALEAINRKKYDVILLDIMMPEMDGYEFAREVCRLSDKANRPRMIAMTANVMESDREKCIKSGMDDFIPKPVRKSALKEALRLSLVKAL